MWRKTTETAAIKRLWIKKQPEEKEKKTRKEKRLFPWVCVNLHNTKPTGFPGKLSLIYCLQSAKIRSSLVLIVNKEKWEWGGSQAGG